MHKGACVSLFPIATGTHCTTCSTINTLKCNHFFVRYFAYLPAQNYASSISTIFISIHTKYSTGKHASLQFLHIGGLTQERLIICWNTERLNFWTIRMYTDSIISILVRKTLVTWAACFPYWRKGHWRRDREIFG